MGVYYLRLSFYISIRKTSLKRSSNNSRLIENNNKKNKLRELTTKYHTHGLLLNIKILPIGLGRLSNTHTHISILCVRISVKIQTVAFCFFLFWRESNDVIPVSKKELDTLKIQHFSNVFWEDDLSVDVSPYMAGRASSDNNKKNPELFLSFFLFLCSQTPIYGTSGV